MAVSSSRIDVDRQNGWWLFWLLAGAVVAASLLTGMAGGFSVEAIRAVVRLTAQMSLMLFCTAFAASALARLWPGRTTHFIRSHRRQIGLAFAVSHAVHAIALFAFAKASPAQFADAVDPAMYVFGGIAYVFIIAMTVTSFDRTAAWLGAARWRLLHTIGSYDIWLTFAAAEGKRAALSSHYWPFVALLLVVMGLKVAAALTRRAQTRRA